MKVAIVGPEESKWTQEDILNVKAKISKIFFKYLKKYWYDEYNYGTENEVYLGYTTKYDFDCILVSGHCPMGGVDIWAEEIANISHIKKEIYPAEVNQWLDSLRCCSSSYCKLWDNHDDTFKKCGKCIMLIKDKGYRSRNIQIAEACDVLYCIVPKTCESNPKLPEELDTGIGWMWDTSNKKYFCNHCQVFGHPSNGGCWTMKYAKKLGKETHLVVIE